MITIGPCAIYGEGKDADSQRRPGTFETMVRTSPFLKGRSSGWTATKVCVATARCAILRPARRGAALGRRRTGNDLPLDC